MFSLVIMFSLQETHGLRPRSQPLKDAMANLACNSEISSLCVNHRVLVIMFSLQETHGLRPWSQPLKDAMANLACNSKISSLCVNHRVLTTDDGIRKQVDIEILQFPVADFGGLVIVSLQVVAVWTRNGVMASFTLMIPSKLAPNSRLSNTLMH